MAKMQFSTMPAGADAGTMMTDDTAVASADASPSSNGPGHHHANNDDNILTLSPPRSPLTVDRQLQRQRAVRRGGFGVAAPFGSGAGGGGEGGVDASDDEEEEEDEEAPGDLNDNFRLPNRTRAAGIHMGGGGRDRATRHNKTNPKNEIPLDLHKACLSSPSLTEIRTIFRTLRKSGTEMMTCAQPDPSTGRVPLHCVGLNEDLILHHLNTTDAAAAGAGTGSANISGGDTGAVASSRVERFVLTELLVAYPAAIIEEDRQGRIPFTELVHNWVKEQRAKRRWKKVKDAGALAKDMNAQKLTFDKVAKKLMTTIDENSNGAKNGEKQKKDRDTLLGSGARHRRRALGEHPHGLAPGQHGNGQHTANGGGGADDDDAAIDQLDLPPMVEWSLRMLSRIVERTTVISAASASSSSNGRGSFKHSPDWFRAGHTSKSAGNHTEQQNRKYSLDSLDSNPSPRNSVGFDAGLSLLSLHADIVVGQVASIPFLIQELLVLEDKHARDRVFSLTVVRRVLLCKSSYFGNGSWLMTMLHRTDGGGGRSSFQGLADRRRRLGRSRVGPLGGSGGSSSSGGGGGARGRQGRGTLGESNYYTADTPNGPDYAEAAVYYLEQISSLSSSDDVGVQFGARSIRHMHASNAGKGLGRLTVLGADDTDVSSRDALYDEVGSLDGLLTALVVLDERLVDRAAVTTVIHRVLYDTSMSSFATVAGFFDGFFVVFLIWSFRCSVAAAAQFLSMGGGGEDSSVMVPQAYFLWSTVLVLCAMRFILWDSAHMAATWFLSRDLFWVEFSTFLQKGLGPYLALFVFVWTDLSLRFHAKKSRGVDTEDYRSNESWLPFAVAITTGILWLKLFGHLKALNVQLAVFILSINNILRDIKWFLLVMMCTGCAFAQMFTSLSAYDLVQSGGPPNQIAADAAQLQSPSHYVQAYAIILGAFEIGDYQRTTFTLLLFVAYTLSVSIILLNVLIAIVSDSYEKAVRCAKKLFGRARVMFVAEVVALHRFYKQNDFEGGDMWLSRETVMLASLVTALFLIMRACATAHMLCKNRSDDIGILELVGCLTLLLLHYTQMLIMRRVVSEHYEYDERNSLQKLAFEARPRGTLDIFLDGIISSIQAIMAHLLTSSFDEADDISADEADGSRSVTPSTISTERAEIESLQQRDALKTLVTRNVKRTEQLSAEILDSDERVHNKVDDIESRLTSAMKATESRIEALVASSEARILKAIQQKTRPPP